MQNALRKWLVGTGLLVLLLAFAVPALAQNQWTASSTTFLTPVQSMALSLSYGQLSVGTYGGGFPGGTNGNYYYDGTPPYGDSFTGPVGAPAPANDDITVALWDGPPDALFFGTWNNGLYQWVNPGPWFHVVLPPFVNSHITSLAVDPTAAGAGIPHVLYVGTWGGAVYSYDGTTWTQIPNYFNPGTYPAAQFIHKVAVIPAACNAQPLTIYAATDGYGVVKGVKNCISGVWSWSQVGSLSGDDAYVYALALDGSGTPFIGTRAGNVYFWASGTWNALSFSPAITTPVKDLVFDGMNGLFVATWGQGVYRYNFVKDAGAAINTGYGGANLTYLYDSVLVWDGTNKILYVGAGNMGGPGAQGKVFRITLTPPTIASPFNKTNLACTAISDNLMAASNQNPKNWSAAVTSGNLPPGYTVNVNNTPATPVVTIDGSATQDCTWNSIVSVWDSLLNETDVAVNYTIQLKVSFTVDNDVVPLGTIQAFTSTVCGATGNLSYAWNFGDGAPFPAVDSTLANPTHIYASAGIYTVTLWVSDSACPGGPIACPATPPDNCASGNVTVNAPLSVDPTATITGSGSQFQFNAHPSGGDTVTCAGYTFSWVFTDQFTHAQVGTSTQENPVITFAYTGSFVGTVTVTDCAGHTAVGSCTVNYNGPMSATIAVDVNPVPDDHAILFLITAQGCGAGATFRLDFDPGDGSGLMPGIHPTTSSPGTAQWLIPLGPPLVIGTHTATATIHDGLGCGHTTIITYNWTVYAHFDHITIAPSGWTCPPNPGGHVPQTVSFTVTPTGGLPNYLYSVDWGDGSTTAYPNRPAGATTISHQYTTAGQYTITVYATDSGYYAVTLSHTYGPFTLGNATVGHIGAAGANQPGCQQYSTTQPVTYTLFNDTVLSAGVLATNFTYDFDYGDGSPHAAGAFAGATVTLGGHLYTIPVGYTQWTYTQTLVVHNNITCENHTSTFQVTIYYPLLPPAAPTWLQSCGSRLVTFTAIAPTTGIGPYTYIWDFGDATPPVTTATPTATHTYALNGNFNCQLTVIDSVCGAGFHNTVNTPFIIRVVQPITVSIATTYTPTCAPESAAFTSTAAGGGLVPPDPSVNFLNYLWSYSGPAGGSFSPSAAVANPTFNFTAPGNYDITLTVTSADVGTYSCSSNTVHIVAYGGITAASLSFTQTETSGYLPLNDTFTTNWDMTGLPSSPVTLTYDWGDGTANTVVYNATSPDITQHTFTRRSGSLGWKVSITATDTCGNTENVWRYIVILAPPVLGGTTNATPQVGVAPMSVNFAVNATGGVPTYRFRWDFGDGNSSTDQNPSHIYTTPGIYHPSVQIGDNWPCDDPGISPACDTYVGVDPYMTGHWTAPIPTGPITVYAPLSVQAAVNPALGMVGTTSFGFTSTVAGGDGAYTYLWNFGDGQTSTGVNPFHIYNNPGTYSAVLTVNDGAGHVGTSNAVLVTVYPNLNVTGSVNPTTVYPLPGSVTVTANALGGDGNYSYYYQWETAGVFEGPFTGPTANSRNHQYTLPGDHFIQVKVIDGLGNIATLSSALMVSSYDLLTLSINGTPVGSGDYVPKQYTFTSAVLGGSGGNNITWNFGDGSTGSGPSPIHTYTVPGTYSATATVTDSVSHVAASNTINITVYGTLTVSVSATPQQLFINQPFTFNAIAAGGDGVYSYAWSFSGGETGTGATVNKAFATAGSKTASVIVSDGAGHSASASVNVTVWDPLTISASATPTAGEKTLNVTFSASAAGGAGGYTYAWDFGDGSTSTSQNPSKGYSVAGIYFAKVTVKDSANNTKTSDNIQITVYAPLTATLSGTPTSGTLPLPVTFTAVAAGGDGHYTYSYDYGDGSALSSNPNHTYTAAGTYTATVTVTDTASHTATSNSVTITVWAPMTASIVSDKTTGVGNSVAVTFTRTVAGGDGSYSYSWNFGDGLASTSSSASVTHNYAPGLYAATLTVSDGSSHVVTSNTINIAIYAPMSVSGSASPQQLFVNQPFTFNAIAAGGDGIYSYAWSFSDGTTGTGATVNKAFATAGSKTATVTVTDSIGGTGHSATTTVTVTVWDALTVSASATPTSGNKPLPVSFSASAAGGAGGYTFAWDFGDGSTSASQNPSKTYAVAGIYFARVTAKDSANNTKISDNIQITVYEPMSVSLSGTPTSGTLPLPVTFTANAAGGDGHYTYSYNYGDGSAASANPNHTYAAAGTYTATVTVTDTASHTATSNNVTITVWAPLTATITGTKQGTGDYVPMTYNFTSAVAGGNQTYTYSWNFGDGGTSAAANPSHTYTTAGSYAVTLVVADSASHAVTSNTINITLYAPLAVSASATPSTLIVGNSVTFNAVATGGNGVYSYAWTFGDGGTGSGATVNHTYATKGTYTAHVVVTDGASHTVTSANLTITVKPVPPEIVASEKLTDPFRIKLLGVNFQSGCTATINGTPVTVSFKNSGKIILKNCSSLCPNGVAVQIVVTNPDGGVSNPYQFVR